MTEPKPTQPRTYLGLPLTIDQAVGRYLRHIAWGQECADYLRKQGFDEWCDKFRASHQRYADEGGKNEWDSRDYTDDEMRQIYHSIITNAERRTIPDEQATETGTLFFGNQDGKGTGTRYALRYRVVGGAVAFDHDDWMNISSALVDAYGEAPGEVAELTESEP